MEAKGKTLLRVSGIFFIIWGIIDIVLYGIMTLFLGVGTLQDANVGKAIVTAIAVAYLIASVILLIAGVYGVKNSKNVEKASTCCIFGVIVLVFTVATSVYSVIQTRSLSDIISMACSIIIPSLYIFGAVLNRKKQ